MTSGHVVILDGTAGLDPEEARVAAVLGEVVGDAAATIETFALRDERMSHCIGCFGCWTETPGLCRAADRGRDIVRAMIQADTVVLLTPVTFGGYSSTLKRLVDRWIQVLLPFFEKIEGELHHPLRYGRFPRLVAIGVQGTEDEGEAALFRALVARNALNFHAPSHAVEVVGAGDSDDRLRARLAAALTRHDAIPARATDRALVPEPVAPDSPPPAVAAGNVLVLVGSPKTKTPSTSGVLGRHLLTRMQASGWRGEVLTITAAIRQEAWREKLLAAVDAADLVVLAFPLYIDALPTLLTRALELVREHRRTHGAERPQQLAVVVNSGFPEADQNLLAVGICARFAAACAMTWAGGLAMGAGEALSSGAPLSGPEREKGRPPAGHVVAALDLAAAELAVGRPVPQRAADLIARTPIPLLPFSVWRRLFAVMGGLGWRQQATGNGVPRAALLARPFQAGSESGTPAAP